MPPIAPQPVIAFYTETYTVVGMPLPTAPETLSITDASSRGISGLARDAEAGVAFLVKRRNSTVAAIIGADRFYEYEEAERDLRDLSLVVARVMSDGGRRTSLDDVISRFGFDRAALAREVEEDLAAGRD